MPKRIYGQMLLGLYKDAINLAPDEDYYYLFLGRSYLEQAKTETKPDQLVLQAASRFAESAVDQPAQYRSYSEPGPSLHLVGWKCGGCKEPHRTGKSGLRIL